MKEPYMEKVELPNATLYCGDCLDILPTLDKVDCVITDPPYGIKRDKGFEGFEGFGGFGTPIARTQYHGKWDDERPYKSIFDLINSIEPCLIFGGNYFADMLPQGKHWIVWNKLNTMPTFSDAELIWTNVKRNSVKIKTFQWNGLIGKEKYRDHATQKPVGLMEILINDYTKSNHTILDPFMGSGTTGVAALKLGRKFIGIEISEEYFEIAVDRISKEANQLKMF